MYGKLFVQMYDGSLRANAPWQALVTFQQLVILANKQGEVNMTAVALSGRTGIPIEIIEAGLSALQQPDPDSQSKLEEGRRIVLIDPARPWGWRLVNYEHYRKIRSEEERREYQRNLMRDRRLNGSAPASANGHLTDANGRSLLEDVSNVSPGSKQYAVSSKKRKRTTQATKEPSPFPKSVCDALYETWISVRGVIQYSAFRKALLPLYPAAGPRHTEQQLVAAIKCYAEWVEGLSPREAGFETIYRFVGDVARWVRLGAMPVVDPETHELTERGQLA